MNKDRLTEITDPDELAALRADRSALERPYTFSHRIQGRIHFYADDEELRAWRASQHTSATEPQ